MPKLFNVYGFEPPHPVKGASFCPWVDHSVSGLPPATMVRPIQTRFRYGSTASNGLALPQRSNSPVHYAKGTPSTRAPRRGPSGLRLLVDAWFQVLLTPLIAVLFTFQSPYLFTIGRPGVLSLGGWAPRLHTEFHGIRATLGHLSTESSGLYVQDCHLLWSAFPDRSVSRAFVTPRGPATPVRRPVWARSAFARRYSRSLG